MEGNIACGRSTEIQRELMRLQGPGRVFLGIAEFPTEIDV